MKKAGGMVNFPTEDFINGKIAIAIVGPTAIGKTTLSLFLSDIIPVEIISADSRQVFRYLDIGTAKPSVEERTKVAHHFIDICNPDEYYSAGQFGKDSSEVVQSIFQRNKIPLIVGGSGLYIKALCEGLFEEKLTYEEKVKALEIRKELAYYSREALYAKLMEVDPETARLYPDKNYIRLIRALEFYLVKGFPISFFRKHFATKPKFQTIYIGLTCNRKYLYSLINQRVDKMWRLGLADEVRSILQMGYSPQLNSLNTVGYKETIDYLQGKITENDAIEQIKQNTRRYAKRQITWFKKVSNINWFDVTNSKYEINILKFLINISNKNVMSI
ncbi:MAG: tRNA (adenosine(37)-N6)-dimethylallyltransferase MiaA [Candidatus Kapaibacteriota bacterium]